MFESDSWAASRSAETAPRPKRAVRWFLGIGAAVLFVAGASQAIQQQDSIEAADSRCHEIVPDSAPETEFLKCFEREASKSSLDVAMPWVIGGTGCLVLLGANLIIDRRKTATTSDSGVSR
jgi:hypothetical protein